MKYLDEDIEINVTGFTVASSETYVYQVKMQQPNGSYAILFVGNCWLNAGDTSKKFYLNDLLNTCRDGFDKAWMKPYEYYLGSVDLYNKIQVVLTVGANNYTGTEDVLFAYRYGNRKSALEHTYHYRNQMTNSELAYNMLQGTLLPHIPYKLTTDYPFIQTIQWNNQQSAYNVFKYHFSGGVSSSDMQLSLPQYREPCMLMSTLQSLFGSSTSDGKDGLLSIISSQDNYENVTSSCTIEHDDEIWIEDQDGYLIGQPTTIEIYTINGTTIGEIPSSAIHSTTTYHFDSGEQTIDFDNEVGFEIWGDCTTGQGSIYISNPNKFVGTCKAKFSFDYIYNERGGQDGRVYNLKIEIKKQDAKVFNCAIIDACPSDYYIMWQDRYGGFQSQRFDKTTVYSESFNYKEIQNYKNEKFHSGVEVTPKWKVNTGFLDSSLVPYYESIFTNKNLLLYDTKQDKSYIVNVTDAQYTEKTFKNQSGKMFNLSLNLELNKKQNIQY